MSDHARNLTKSNSFKPSCSNKRRFFQLAYTKIVVGFCNDLIEIWSEMTKLCADTANQIIVEGRYLFEDESRTPLRDFIILWDNRQNNITWFHDSADCVRLSC